MDISAHKHSSSTSVLHVNAKNLDIAILITVIVSVILGQRIVVPLAGLYLPTIVPVLYFALFLWGLTRRIAISRKRFVFLALSLIAILFAYLMQGVRVGLSSLMFLIAIYLPLLFVHRDIAQREVLIDVFQNTMVVMALVGIVQFLLQFAGVPLIDLFNMYLPHEWVIANYNYLIRVSAGLDIRKANAIFFLEPSTFSCFLAIAILIELYYGRYTKRVVYYLPAMLLSFSGTGVIMLASGLVFIFSKRINFRRLAVPALVASLIVVGFFFSSYGGYWLRRVGEFERPGTSGYTRFVAPVDVFSRYLSQADQRQLLFGNGPGTVEETLRTQYSSLSNLTTSFLVKLFFEYGLLAGFVFLTFMIVSYFDRAIVFPVAFSLFILQVLISGLLQVQTLYLGYMLTMLFARRTGTEADPPTTSPEIVVDNSQG